MWVKSTELREIGVAERTLYRKTKKGEWVSQKGKSEGRGKPPLEILLSSLPEKLQMQFAAQQEKRASAVVADVAEPVAPGSDARLDTFVAALARFSPPEYSLEQKEAIQRRCTELARLCDDTLESVRNLKAGDGLSHTSPGSREAGHNRAYRAELHALASRTISTDAVYLALYPSAANPLSVSSLLRLIEKYRREGLVAFIREKQTLSPEADNRFLGVDSSAINWLRANLKSYIKTSVTVFGERWLEWARRNDVELPFTNSRPGQPGTCYAWLYRWKQSVPSVAMTLAREGMRGVENRFAIITRSYEELEPRVGWTMDWRTFDMACWLPFKKDKSKKPALVRLTLCTVFDLKARAVFGYHVANRPTARGVTLAYVDALSFSKWKEQAGFTRLYGMQRGANGIEAFVLWDNGKEFVACLVEGKEIKVGKIDLEFGLTGTLETLKVGLAVDAQFQVRHAKPYNAKSKTVEPFHRYGVGLWEEGMPGFCGNKVTAKPHFYKAALAIHKAFTNGDTPKSEDLRQLPPLWRDTYEVYKDRYGYGTPFLSEEDFRAAWQKRAIEYNLKAHGALTNERGEMSPIEYLDLFGGEPHKMSETTLMALAMEVRVETVDCDRITLRWYGEKFTYNEVVSKLSDGTALMRLPERTKVAVHFNPDNIGRALVLAHGVTLCWIESPELMGWNASREDFQRANAAKKRAQQTAEEYFRTPQQPNWRDHAAERLPEALPMAVGAEETFLPVEKDEERGASVTVISRFDRKSPDAITKPANRNLHAVESCDQEDDFAHLKRFEEDSNDDQTPVKEWWDR